MCISKLDRLDVDLTLYKKLFLFEGKIEQIQISVLIDTILYVSSQFIVDIYWVFPTF